MCLQRIALVYIYQDIWKITIYESDLILKSINIFLDI